MKFEVIGMSELIDKINKYHDTPNKVGNKALKAASQIVLEVEKSTLLSMHRKDRSTGKGAANLKVGNIKTYSSGSKFVGVGFTKDKMGGASWDDIKGAYFNHYGWYNNRGGNYVAGSNWLGVAYDKAVDASYTTMKNILIAELNKVG